MSAVSYKNSEKNNPRQALNSICYKSGSELGLSPKLFPKIVTNTIKTLEKKGYQGYVVGGSLRDILLGKIPKDFDIATSAHPKQVRNIFKDCRLIGRRFRLAHVYQHGQILEVATFRAADTKGPSRRSRRGLRDNVYGTLEQDIMRRDFTINAIYYNPLSDQLVCHYQTLPDIADRCLRLIGEPALRYREDPVRILRALRFVAKLDLQISPESEQQIVPHRALLRDMPPARLLDECGKFFNSGVSLKIYQLLKQYRLLEVLFPQAAEALKHDPAKQGFDLFLCKLFENTDKRVAASEPITPAFMFAGLWWRTVQNEIERLGRRKSSHSQLTHVFEEIVYVQRRIVAVPAHLREISYQILMLQPYFLSHRRKDIQSLLEHRRFRAAYDFFCLLSKAKLANYEVCQWWQELQQTTGSQRAAMIQNRVKHGAHKQPVKRKG